MELKLIFLSHPQTLYVRDETSIQVPYPQIHTRAFCLGDVYYDVALSLGGHPRTSTDQYAADRILLAPLDFYPRILPIFELVYGDDQ